MLLRRAWARRFAVALSFTIPTTVHAVGNILGSCPGTGDKPQSKIWYNDGSYWAVLQNGTGSHIFRLAGGTWQAREHIDSHRDNSLEGHEDVVWNGRELFVLVYSGTPLLYKFTYDNATDAHVLASGFPVAIPDASGSETMVIDQDSTGRLWAVYEAGGRIYAAHSIAADHTTWETPGIVLRDGVNDDDVAAVVRFGDRVGVFWSDQNRWEFGFRTHLDGAAPGDWSSTEVVRPGVGNSDDHLNLCADSAGRVYAITKDVENEFAVHRRNTNGTWTTKTNITGGQTGTRCSIMLDATETKLYALYTCWDCGGSDPIVYRIGSTSTLAFGSATTLISETDQSLNDVTDMKQLLPPGGLMAIASGGGRAYWNGWGTPPADNGFGGELPGDPEEPPPPPGPPVPTAPGIPTAFIATQATRHTPPGIAACWGFDETTGNLVENALDTTEKGTLGAAGTDTSEPVRAAGITGGALRFDGANDYVEIAPRPALDIPGSFTVEAWIRRTMTGTPDVIVAKEGTAGRNYRLRVTTGDLLELAWETASGSSRTVLGTRLLTDGQWHHVAGVHDQALGQDRLYIDGVLDIAKSQSGTPAPCVDPLLIGARRSNGIKEPLAGDIDLVRIASLAVYSGPFTPPLSYDLGPSTHSLVLSWGAPATGGAPTGYTLRRSANAEEWLPLTPAPLTATSFVDPEPLDGILRYTISASNDIGTGAESQPVEISFGTGPRPPQMTGEPAMATQKRQQPMAGDVIWSFDDGPATISLDATTKGHALVLGTATAGDGAEPTWTDGVAGSALHFDGVNDYGRADDALDLRYAGSFTVEAWVRPAALGAYAVLVAKESSTTGRNYRLALTQTGKLELSWKNMQDATQVLSTQATLMPGRWTHVAGVFDAALGESRVYVDGRLSGRKPTPGLPQTTDVAVRVGARLASSSLRDYFGGDLDQMRLTGLALYSGDFTPAPQYGPRIETTHRLAWNPATPGTARLLGYRIERRIDNGPWTAIVPAPIEATALEVVDAGGSNTCYRIIAIDRLQLASPPIERCQSERSRPQTPVLAKTAVALPSLAASPNPFNPSTTILLRLSEPAEVDARLYDVRGRCLRTLARGPLTAGEHRLGWDGRDDAAVECAAGVYFVHVRAGDRIERLKLVLAK